MRLVAVLVTAFALSVGDGPRSAHTKTIEAVPVVDLQIDLASNVEQPLRNIWRGIGQAGIVQLHQGHVEGLLTSYPTSADGVAPAELAIRFARFRSALGTTQAFDSNACGRAPGRVATWFELDAPDSLAAEPDEVVSWTLRGIRVFSLVGKRDGLLASSGFPSGPERVVGLTPAGRRVAETVMRAGALVDVSNLSDAALLEVLDLAKQLGTPVLASHTSSRAVRARPGSLSDWQLRAIAQTGGMIGVTFDRDAIGEGGQADLGDVLRQLEHVLRVAGPDAVALASGFETGAIHPLGLKSAARFPRLADALLASGMSREDLRKLFHDNAVRVLCGSRNGDKP